MNLKEIKEGDLFSEVSHYVVDQIVGGDIVFSLVTKKGKDFMVDDKKVKISANYIEQNLQTGDQYTVEQKVTREDKQDGTLGIRSIFESLAVGQPFTVVYQKQDTTLSNAAYQKALSDQITSALAIVEKAKTSKKGVLEAATEQLRAIQTNPVSRVIPGELRTLRGYKLTGHTRDGKYDCLDIEKLELRPVNINTISKLIANGVLYHV